MGKYYLLSPGKLEVKNADGQLLDLSLDDLLSTLDCLDKGQGLYLQLPQVDGKLPIYKSSRVATAAALKAYKPKPESHHVVVEVELTKEAQREVNVAANRHDKSQGPFSYPVSFDAITFKRASLKHVNKQLPSYDIAETRNQTIKSAFKSFKKKFPKPILSKSNFINHFALLMLAFFAIGFIFAYSGLTSALLLSLVKMGLLETSSSLALKFGASATISLLLWDACFLTLFVGNKLFNLAKAGYHRYVKGNEATSSNAFLAPEASPRAAHLNFLLSTSALPSASTFNPVGGPAVNLMYSDMSAIDSPLPHFGSATPSAVLTGERRKGLGFN